MIIRTLSTFAECREVTRLEQQVWTYDDAAEVVPAAVLLATVLRGGVLLGAFDETGVLQGYAYAAPAIKDGQSTLWSHALGVLPEARGRSIGAALKIAQRQHALRMRVDLIEWTCDPLQASGAQLNFAKLGVVVEAYEENLYGESSSPLHHGVATDRFIAEWHLSTPHVERRIAAAAPKNPAAPAARRASPPLTARDGAVIAAILVNPSRERAGALEPGDPALDVEAARLLVEIPTNFTELLRIQPDLAREWRHVTRTVFRSYFARGYRAVDFFLSREHGRGQYLLARAAS
jgi:predicted GNAT superfamily acetyltransferase